MTKRTILILALVMLLSLFVGCSEKAEPTVGTNTTEATADQPVESTEKPTVELTEVPTPEQPGVLEGFADNKSYEIYASNETYKHFKTMDLSGAMQEVYNNMLDNGFVKDGEPYNHLKDDSKALTVMLVYAGEEDGASLIMTQDKDGVFNSIIYKRTVKQCKTPTGFHASKEVFNALKELIDTGEVATVSDIEKYFGKGYITRIQLKEDKVQKIFNWTHYNATITCIADVDGNIVVFTAGALPEVYAK